MLPFSVVGRGAGRVVNSRPHDPSREQKGVGGQNIEVLGVQGVGAVTWKFLVGVYKKYYKPHTPVALFVYL